MAFVSRKNNENNTDKNINNGKRFEKEKPFKSVDIIADMKSKNSEAKEKNDYLEKSKVIITHLEKKMGFDFYDENRVGGMHLKGSKHNPTSKQKNIEDEKVNSGMISLLLSKIKNK